MELCKYSEALGVPKQGFHAQRIAGVALWDVVGTLVLAWILRKFTHWSFLTCCVAMFASGIVLHRVFCVRTTVDKWLFG